MRTLVGLGIVGSVMAVWSAALAGCSDGGGVGEGPVEATLGAAGGELEHGSGVTLRVPAGAVTEDRVFRIEAVAEAGSERPLHDLNGADIGVEFPIGDTHFQLGPDDVFFSNPVVLTVPFDPANGALGEEYFVLTREGLEDAEPTPVAVGDMDQRELVAQLSHFSKIRRTRVEVNTNACAAVEVTCDAEACVATDGAEILYEVESESAGDGEVVLNGSDEDGNFPVTARGKADRPGGTEAFVRHIVTLLGCNRLASGIVIP